MRLITMLAAASLLPVWATAQTPAGPTAPQPSSQPQAGPVMRMRVPSPPPAYSGEIGETALRLINGVPTVEVMVDGRGPFRFLVDTGAGGHARISRKAVRALGLTPSGEVRSGDGSGRSVVAPVYTLPSLTFAGVTFEGIQAGELNLPAERLPGVDGVLGLGLFASHTLTLDYAGARLRLDQSALPTTAVAYDARSPIIAFPLRIGDETVPTHLDTGNTVAPLILPKALADRLPKAGPPRPGRVARTRASAIQMYDITLAAPVRLGEAELSITEAAYPSLGANANLGSLALAGSVLRVDQRNRRFSIERASDPAAVLSCPPEAVAVAERAWLDAYARLDAVAMETLLHPAFVITYPDGGQGDRSAVLGQLRRQAARGGRGPRFTTSGARAHPFGSTVVLTGEVRSDQPGAAPSRYTDTWVCDGGGWRVAASHLA